MGRQEALQELNRLMASLMPRMPNIRYWETKRGDPYKFCWTTERVRGKFYAVIYRVKKDGTWVLKKKTAFGKRRVAKKRSYSWMQKRLNKQNNN